MEKQKDCKIIFCDKKEYEFSSADLAKALAFCQGKRVWAIKTPWCVLSLMDEEEFDNVYTIMGEDHTVTPDNKYEDLVV